MSIVSNQTGQSKKNSAHPVTNKVASHDVKIRFRQSKNGKDVQTNFSTALPDQKVRRPPIYWEPLTWPEEHCWPNLLMYLGMVLFQSLSSVAVFLTFWHCSSVMESLCFWASSEE